MLPYLYDTCYVKHRLTFFFTDKNVFSFIFTKMNLQLIIKKVDPQLSPNYCPIFVLLVFSNLFEKCMYSGLYSFLTRHKCAL